jgi:hypothetical protein
MIKKLFKTRLAGTVSHFRFMNATPIKKRINDPPWAEVFVGIGYTIIVVP